MLRSLSRMKSATFPLSLPCITSTASADAGMAFLNFPPFRSDSLTSNFSERDFTNCAMHLMALMRFLSISSPECPPLKPEIFSLIADSPSEDPRGALLIFILISALMPPAHPMTASPSVSLSRFSRYLDFRHPGFRAEAPPIVVSSPVVKSSSSGPCTRFGSVAAASATATPIPSSAPRDVPSEKIKPFSIFTGRGVLTKSKSSPSLATATISVCP